MSTEKRKPTWSICVKEGERWRSIGGAWETERGNLWVKIDAGCRLEGTAMMFPYREKPPGGRPSYRQQWARPTMRPASPPPAAEGDYMERKRQERQGASATPSSPPPYDPPTPVTRADDLDPDPEPPDWL